MSNEYGTDEAIKRKGPLLPIDDKLPLKVLLVLLPSSLDILSNEDLPYIY